MAHFAEIDENNIVLRVVVTDNNDQNGDEGYQWLVDNLGGRWVKTSYNANIRKNFAGIGYKFDEVLDAFIAPQPFLSWVLNENTCSWDAPKPYPKTDKKHVWDEETLDWIEVNG
jgi:hypothetical protein